MKYKALNSLYTLMNLVHLYINRQSYEDVTSPLQLRDGDEYDFIIVGAGSAGCVLANRLSEIENWKVLLLEAGGEESLLLDVPSFQGYVFNSRVNWKYQTEPQDDICGGKTCEWPRGKVLGGTSTLNNMVYNRGNRRDYDHWSELGNTGWSYEEVLPYFKKSENNRDPGIANDTRHHSTGGYLSVERFPHEDKNVHTLIKAYKELGYDLVDFNSDHVTGVMLVQGTQHNGERRSTNRAFLEPVRDVRSNLNVVTNIRVTKVLIHPENNTAYGVEYAYEMDRSQRGKIFATKEIIVSGGTVNSPQLLMLSGIGPKEVLQSLNITIVQDLSVGKNLQDHVGAEGIRYNLTENASIIPTKEDLTNDFEKYTQMKRDGPLAGTGVNQLEGYIKSRLIPQSEDYPDIEFYTFTDIVSDDPNVCCFNENSALCYYNTVPFRAGPVRPYSRGEIIINSTDPFKPPLIYPNYFKDPRDLEVVIDALNFGVKLSNTDTLKNAGFSLDKTPMKGCEHHEFGTDPYWVCLARNYTRSIFHPAGTCKMGPRNDSSAVVCPELRVHGVKGLRVADASIMPKVISGNLNAVAIMIAEKCADLVKRSWNATTKENRLIDKAEKLIGDELTSSMQEIVSIV